MCVLKRTPFAPVKCCIQLVGIVAGFVAGRMEAREPTFMFVTCEIAFKCQAETYLFPGWFRCPVHYVIPPWWFLFFAHIE